MKQNLEKFKNLGFSDFQRMALDNSLTRYEKIGFPNHYREGFEKFIFEDIQKKLLSLQGRNHCILDIGPGLSDLPGYIIDLCRHQHHTLILIDSNEVLSQLPDEDFIIKIAGCYPDDSQDLFERFTGKIDAIICYSVFHYIFNEGNIFRFLDQSLSLLADGGEMLIGDIPNISKRKRFFSSPNGIRFHQNFMQTDNLPEVNFNCIDQGQIDDSVIFSILGRCRSGGFDAFVTPQDERLSMANRREDILIRKP